MNLAIKSTKGVIANHAQGLTFENVQVTPAKGPVFDLSDASDITIEKSVAPAGTDVFLQLAGKNSSGILIEASNLTAAKKPVVTGDGVATNAVTIK